MVEKIPASGNRSGDVPREPGNSSEIRRDGYIFKKAKRRKHAKYDVFKGDKYLFSFGDRRYGQFRDSLGIWSHLDTLDPKRKELYFKRHGPLIKGEVSPDSFAKRYLWN